jgi:2'-5' RNA ligase
MSAGRAEGRIRGFVAIQVETEARRTLRQVQERLQQELPARTVTWTRPEQMHLTLKFLGQVPKSQLPVLLDALERACHAQPRFDLHLAALGAFPNLRTPRTIWAGLRSLADVLVNLQKRIETETRACGFPAEDREFHPHLTLGRVRRANARELRGVGKALAEFRGGIEGAWTVREIDLMQSDLSPTGSTYTCLGSVKLAAG